MPAGWVYMKKFFRRYSKSFSQHPNERHYFSDARQVALDDFGFSDAICEISVRGRGACARTRVCKLDFRLAQPQENP